MCRSSSLLTRILNEIRLLAQIRPKARHYGTPTSQRCRHSTAKPIRDGIWRPQIFVVAYLIAQVTPTIYRWRFQNVRLLRKRNGKIKSVWNLHFCPEVFVEIVISPGSALTLSVSSVYVYGH